MLCSVEWVCSSARKTLLVFDDNRLALTLLLDVCLWWLTDVTFLQIICSQDINQVPATHNPDLADLHFKLSSACSFLFSPLQRAWIPTLQLIGHHCPWGRGPRLCDTKELPTSAQAVGKSQDSWHRTSVLTQHPYLMFAAVLLSICLFIAWLLWASIGLTVIVQLML